MGFPYRISANDKLARMLRVALPLAATLLLTGACATGPARPLMSAWDDDAGFGYSERKLQGAGPEATWEITYVGPFLRTQLNPAQRAGDVKRLRGLADDMALWRAADLAKAGKYSALKIVTTRSDITVESYNDRPEIIRYGLVHPLGGFRYGISQTPGFRSAWIQPKTVIVVILKQVLGKKDLDADETANRLARKHQGARSLPAY